MKFEMTERDKKLLMILAMIVIVVCIGYWGILPQITRLNEIAEEKEVALEEKEEKEAKVLELPMLEVDNEKFEEGIVDAKKEFFPLMNSDEVDKMMTTMVLGYNLYAYDLSISMPKGEAKLEPYVYSELASSSEGGSGEHPNTGIYSVGISMRLGGKMADFDKIINDLSKTDKKIKLSSFSYGSTQKIITAEDGSLEYEEEKLLNLALEIFMCEE